jgi:hypothetical protein
MLLPQEVKELINEMPTKHCDLDPMPSGLVKDCSDELLPIITEIVNLSLKLGVMPSNLKHALVKPLLKKMGLELNKKNYRPVSNLSFLSKVIESAVIKQYTDHLRLNDLHDLRQSAYKKYHSTETLLIKIHNDLMTKMGNGEISMLVLLDLSAAFDTIDHNILINRLESRYGVSGSALKWFKSYLSNRSQSVVIKNDTSESLPLNYGVPQGSKLGPILFNSYIAPVSQIAGRNNVQDEKYADDQQLILSFKPTHTADQLQARENMEKCIKEIRDFLHQNMLCNNGDKTELLIIGSVHKLKQLDISSINVDNMEIKALSNVRNLGVIFDKHMSMEKHINKMCQNAYFNIRNISKIRNCLNKEEAKTAVNALVTPHLDYGNGLLYGITKKLENKLQMAQNSAVRVIERIKGYESITQYRKDLHWLPIPARIEYKLLTTAWKSLNDQAPEYLKSLIHRESSSHHNLRSNNKVLLSIPSNIRNANKYESRAFSRSAPKLWNNLPEQLQTTKTLVTFKKNLKTHLFSKFYT